MTEEFVVVKSRRKKGRNGVIQGVTNCLERLSLTNKSHVLDSGPDEVTSDSEAVKRKVNAALLHLESSGFLSYCKDQVDEALGGVQSCWGGCREVSRIVSFGLGNFSTCQIARYQLGLLVGLQKHLTNRSGEGNQQDVHVELFDPVFTSQEKVTLRKMGFEVLTVNEEGRRTVQEPTLFYLPHCSHQLVNNLLYSNWSSENLSKCVIVANSFSNIHESVPQNILCRRLGYIARTKGMFVEFELESRFQYNDIFNDTSIHIFPKMKKAEEFWEDRVPPNYDETDFVSCERMKS